VGQRLNGSGCLAPGSHGEGTVPWRASVGSTSADQTPLTEPRYPVASMPKGCREWLLIFGTRQSS
jgi:hypothetical protein